VEKLKSMNLIEMHGDEPALTKAELDAIPWLSRAPHLKETLCRQQKDQHRSRRRDDGGLPAAIESTIGKRSAAAAADLGRSDLDFDCFLAAMMNPLGR
jgi:hypothetical protein